MTVYGYCHCEEQGDEAIHKPQKVNTKNKKEKEFHEWLIVSHTEIATSCKTTLAMTSFVWLSRCLILRLPRLFQSLAMTVLGCCHCEEWNDEAIHKHTHPFVIARSETTKQSTNHYFLIHSQKNKKINHRLPLCHCEEWNDEAIYKPLFFYSLTEKKKNSMNY